MLTACPAGQSDVFKVDVLHDGKFSEDRPKMPVATIRGGPSEAAFWDVLNHPVSPLS